MRYSNGKQVKWQREVICEILVKLYKFLIRPHLEYACAIWDPHLGKDIQAIENVQKLRCRDD